MSSSPSIFELDRAVFSPQASEYLDSVRQVTYTFPDPETNDPFQVTPDQFVNGFVHLTFNPSLVAASVKLPSIKDVVNYTGYSKEGLVFRFMLISQNISTLSILPGNGDLEFRSSRRTGRLDYFTQGNSIGNQDNRELGENQHAQFLVRLSDYANPLGALMEMYLIGSGDLT